jgi:hypothetical protein
VIAAAASLVRSRKVLVTAMAVLLALLNRKLNLGFSDQDVLVLVGAMAVLVLGIAVEDAGEKSGSKATTEVATAGPEDDRGDPPGTSAAALLFLAVSLTLSSATGCVVQAKVRDEATVASVARAVSAREQDFARYEAELERSRGAALAHAADAAEVRRIASERGVRDLPEAPTAAATTAAAQRGLRALNDAELDRLRQLLAREGSKMDPAEAGAP